MPESTKKPAGFGSCVSLEKCLLALLLIFHLCVNLWWLDADNHPIHADEEMHMLMAREYHQALFPSVGDCSLRERLEAVINVRTPDQNPVHPPLPHVMGALAACILGYSVDTLAFVNTVFFLAALVGVYLLARSFLSSWESLFVVTVVSLTPMIYAASRYFMNDFLSMTLVIWAIYAVHKSRHFRNSRWAFIFAILHGLAMLTRITSALYYLIPAAIAFFLGVRNIISAGPPRRTADLGRLFLNAVMVLIISVSIFSPWYIANRNQFYAYWTSSEFIHVTGGPLAIFAKEQPTPNQSSDPEKKAENLRSDPLMDEGQPRVQDGGEEADTVKWHLRFSRRIPWLRYPVLVINNGVFLPMFSLGVLGILFVCVHARFRQNAAVWGMTSWLIGSYVLLTLLLNFATPRYALQTLPALALISCLPLLSIRRKMIRHTVQALYLAVLMFQFINLTFRAYGSMAEAAVPFYPDKTLQLDYDDHGLYFYKSELHGSFSYDRMGAPTRENFKDRLFWSMLKTEQEKPFSGIEANYVRVNMRGMLLDEQHYWPDLETRPNPYMRKDIPAELTPYRFFQHCGWSWEIEEILPMLLFADYAVYSTENLPPGKEETWLRVFSENGFELIDRFFEKRHGMVRSRYIGLLARKSIIPLPAVSSENDLTGLSQGDLYRLRYSNTYHLMPVPLQQTVRERLNTLFNQAGVPMFLNDHVAYINHHITRDKNGVYLLHLIFKTEKPVRDNYRILVQGFVAPEYMASFFGNSEGRPGLFRWSFSPSPSTCLWPAGEYVVTQIPLNAQPIPYQMQLYFYQTGAGIWGNAIDIGTQDLGKTSDPNKS